MKRTDLLYKQLKNIKTGKPYSEKVESKIILYFILKDYVAAYIKFNNEKIFDDNILTTQNLKYLNAVLDVYKKDFYFRGSFRTYLRGKSGHTERTDYKYEHLAKRYDLFITREEFDIYIGQILESFFSIKVYVEKLLHNVDLDPNRKYIQFKKFN